MSLPAAESCTHTTRTKAMATGRCREGENRRKRWQSIGCCQLACRGTIRGRPHRRQRRSRGWPRGTRRFCHPWQDCFFVFSPPRFASSKSSRGKSSHGYTTGSNDCHTGCAMTHFGALARALKPSFPSPPPRRLTVQCFWGVAGSDHAGVCGRIAQPRAATPIVGNTHRRPCW